MTSLQSLSEFSLCCVPHVTKTLTTIATISHSPFKPTQAIHIHPRCFRTQTQNPAPNLRPGVLWVLTVSPCPRTHTHNSLITVAVTPHTRPV